MKFQLMPLAVLAGLNHYFRLSFLFHRCMTGRFIWTYPSFCSESISQKKNSIPKKPTLIVRYVPSVTAILP